MNLKKTMMTALIAGEVFAVNAEINVNNETEEGNKSLKSVFEAGAISGSLNIFYEKTNVEKKHKFGGIDNGYGIGYANFNYETKDFKGFTFGMGGYLYERMYEHKEDQYYDHIPEKSIMHNLYLKY